MRQLSDLPMHDVRDRLGANPIVVLPIGAIEAHGPHLPLSTDLLIAAHAVDRLVETCGDTYNLWALPPLAYSKSNEHAWAPGTMWLSAATLLAVLGDLGRSLANTNVKKVLFVNAHGGNSALLQVACRDLRLAHGLQTFLAHPFTATDAGNELGMGIHGGHDETSMVLAIRPDLVSMTRAVRAVPEWLASNRYVKWGGAVSFGWLSSDFSEKSNDETKLPLGVIGDPTNASAVHGESLWAQVTETLVGACAEIAAWPIA